MAFKIITDSNGDTPEWVIDKYDSLQMNTPVIIDGVDHLDRKDIFPKEFYQKLRSGAAISTYHISEQMFSDFFRPYAERGDEVLYLCCSTGMAGTFTAATLAYQDVREEFPDFRMTIIDTKSMSLGFGLSVYKCLRMQANGAPKELIIEAAQFFSDHSKLFATVDTLQYLLKGGRISKTSATLGMALGIKPIIIVDGEGRLVASEKVRGRKASLERILQRVGEVGERLEDQIVAVANGDDQETAEFLRDELIRRYHCREVLMGDVGCSIGAHTGPGAVGIVCQNKLDDRFEKYLRD